MSNQIEIEIPNKGWIIIDESADINVGSTVIHGNYALIEGWNWGIHQVEDEKSAANYTEVQKFMRTFKNNPKLQTVITEVVIASTFIINESVPLYNKSEK